MEFDSEGESMKVDPGGGLHPFARQFQGCEFDLGPTPNGSSSTLYNPKSLKFDMARPQITQVRHGTIQNESRSTWYDPK